MSSLKECCKRCGDVIITEELTSSISGSPGDYTDYREDEANTTDDLCDDCFHSLYKKCETCGEYSNREYSYTMDPEKTICDECYIDETE